MSIGSAISEIALYADLFEASMANKLRNSYSHIGNTLCKGSSTKKGNNPKAIKARRKKNKNKKTHKKMKVVLLGLLGNIAVFLLFAFFSWDISPANWWQGTRAACAFLMGAVTLLIFTYYIIELANKK